MIVLRSEPLTNDYSVREIAEFDTKAAILESFAILHLGVAKSYRKGELAWLLDHMFRESSPFRKYLARERANTL